MPFFAPADPSHHLPIRIADGSSTRGPRLGGNAPAIEMPRPLAAGSQYVLTFPLLRTPTVYASVFVNGPTEDMWEAMNGGLQSDDRIVVVRHGDAPRGESREHSSKLSSHPLVVGEALEPDLIDNGEGDQVISSRHKIGGRPYCIQEPELEGAEELLQRGYRQVVQLDFPSAADALVSGSWPFADGLFNLFMKEEPGAQVFWAFQK